MKKRKTLKAFSFENQYGWMNAMKGDKWDALLKTYKSDYKKYQNSILANQFEHELQSQPSYTPAVTIGKISYEMRGAQTLLWSVEGGEQHVAGDIDFDGTDVWAVEDLSDGGEQYTLCYYENGTKRWDLPRAVGPFVAIQKDRCYCIETENFLWMRRLVSVSKKTGKDRRVEFDIKDPQWNLQLVKGVDHSLFLMANNAGVQRCWILQGSSWDELTGYEAFVPVGREKTKPVFFGRKKGETRYEPVNLKGKCPSFEHATPEWFDPQLEFLGTRQFGKRTVWSTKTGKPVLTLIGNIDVDSIGAYHNQPNITVQEPGSYRQTLKDRIESPLCPYANATFAVTKSADGTSVPLVLVKNCRPKYLLCIVYGAYGVPSRMNTDRWKPLLDRGWALCFALVRGGGDHTDAWAEAGRRADKLHSIEDFEACIRFAQKKTHCKAKTTVLYGRSAGGYTVGATLSRHADGSLFRGIYTEVPYVDVLNTTSNPELPLTQLEYNEFGDPNRLENAEALVQLSPIDSLPATGAPTIFVLSRIGLQDKEVFAYESVKWITALRAKESQREAPKLLAIEDKEGHFAPESSGDRERANDLAIVHSLINSLKKSHEGIYQMANTRKNNMRKRRNNSTARKNNARKNNATMGGKRRRSGRKGTTRRGRRSH